MIPKYVHDMNVEKERFYGSALMRSYLSAHGARTSLAHNIAIYGTVANDYFIEDAIKKFVKKFNIKPRTPRISKIDYIKNKLELFKTVYPELHNLIINNFDYFNKFETILIKEVGRPKILPKIPSKGEVIYLENYPFFRNEPYLKDSFIITSDMKYRPPLAYIALKEDYFNPYELLTFIEQKLVPIYLIGISNRDKLMNDQDYAFALSSIVDFDQRVARYEGSESTAITSYLEQVGQEIRKKMNNKSLKRFRNILNDKINYYSKFDPYKLNRFEKDRLAMLNHIKNISSNIPSKIEYNL